MEAVVIRNLKAWPAFNVLASALEQTRFERDVRVKLKLCMGRFRGL